MLMTVSNNHPEKGARIKVDPIRQEKDIKLIKRLLADNRRNFAIFVLGINTNLRASDLLRITVGQVRHLHPGDHFDVRERKTGKLRSITINKSVYEAVQKLLQEGGTVEDNAPLFRSRKGGKELCVPYLNSLVKGWCREINLKGNFGSHTLRKTFGYIHRTVFHTDIPTLMQIFNHSTQRQTLAYLGIQPSDIHDAYLKEI
jgi:integrase